MPRAVGTTLRAFINFTLRLVASLVFIGAVVLLKTPCSSYHLGGHFHPFGDWQGKGTLHSTTAGGDYTMWIQLEAAPSSSVSRGPLLVGSAVLCSPRGEYLPLKILAYALGRHGDDLTGVPLHVRMNRWIPLAIPGTVQKPQLDFYGVFGDDVLKLEDRGSLGQAFSPDGRIRESLAKTPSTAETSRVTLEKSTLSRLPDGCII